MSEPFDPSVLQTDPETLPGSPATTSRLGEVLAATTTTWNGVEGLPVDEPDLDGQGELVADPSEPVAAAPAVPRPTEPGAANTPDFQALQQELALLRSELQTMRVASPAAPAPAAAPAPVPGLTLGTIEEREGAIWAAAFQDIEGMDGVGTSEYERARAARYARANGEVRELEVAFQRQENDRAIALRLAAQEDARSQQVAGQQVIDYAVATARVAGYDVHPPGSAEHHASRDSVVFWSVGQARSQAGRSMQDEVKETLSFMPAKTPDLPTPTPRPQPMGRQGTGTTAPGAGPATTPAEGEYQPSTLNQILSAQHRMSRIGAA